jgi:hypothetical protein
VTEFALAIVLLVGAGLLVRSWWYVTSIDPGFKPERVLVIELSTPTTFSVPAQRSDLYQRVLEQIQAVPGVENAGIIGDLFIANSRDQVVTIEGDDGTVSERLRLRGDEVSADFFKAMGTPLLRDRFFRSGTVPMLRQSRSSTMRWLGARGRATIQWAEGLSWGRRVPIAHGTQSWAW